MFEQHLKGLQHASTTSSFSKFTGEDFKQLACKIHDQFYQGMVNLYKGFNDMEELYNSFEHHSEVLNENHKRRHEETKSYYHILEWKKYIKDTPEDLPILDKLKLKKI